jgi:hypothetical protein
MIHKTYADLSLHVLNTTSEPYLEDMPCFCCGNIDCLDNWEQEDGDEVWTTAYECRRCGHTFFIDWTLPEGVYDTERAICIRTWQKEET